jgi:hypothetical protein
LKNGRRLILVSFIVLKLLRAMRRTTLGLDWPRNARTMEELARNHNRSTKRSLQRRETMLLRRRLAWKQDRTHHSDEDLRILAGFLGCEQDFTKGL